MKNPLKNLKLDKEEKEILRSFEAGEWVPVKNQAQEIAKLREAAKNTLAKMKKNKNINIRLTHSDLDNLKIKAQEEGIPYQTLIGSLIHKYVTGRISL